MVRYCKYGQNRSITALSHKPGKERLYLIGKNVWHVRKEWSLGHFLALNLARTPASVTYACMCAACFDDGKATGRVSRSVPVARTPFVRLARAK